ncbi:MAG: hypothetical protein KatS3mg027_2428 [Bacteroidia bacterium]|nr:MAG: hypothetical protein KatS3mg027_2428 [Bacteroidia bacterium]
MYLIKVFIIIYQKKKNYVSTNIVYQNSQIELSNGTLKLKSKYDPNPNSLYSYYGPQILNSSTTGFLLLSLSAKTF